MTNREKPQDKKPADTGFRPWAVLYLFLAISGLLVINEYLYLKKHTENIPYSEFLKYLDEGKLAQVTLSDTMILGELKPATTTDKQQESFLTVPFPDPSLVDRLRQKGVVFRAEARSPFWSFIGSWVLPIFFFYLMWSFLFRRMSGGAPGGMLGLTKSKARVYVEKDTKTSFADVAGEDEAKEELKELVSYLQDPQQFQKLGGRAPKGVLLVGPPGTGKTLLARAVAGEAKVPFFSINGSEFVELFVGLGAARVRDLFEQARKQAPCLLFIDEIDALGKSRAFGAAGLSANDEKEQTLNQLLAEMDGFESGEGVILLAATNRPEILDPALLRAGRFDRQILVNFPDKIGREEILKVHARKITLDPSVRLERIASLTSGFSGADLANLVNEAALFATRRKASAVTEKDFTLALERLVAGLEHKKKVMHPEEKRRIAYHEMGHATVALARGTDDRIHKVSIIARGMGALGYTLQRPTEDRYLMDREEMLVKIAVLLGGRASEKKFFNEVSTGAADDLAKATDIARAMVTQYGMSDTVGLATFEGRTSQYLMGQFQGTQRLPFSERTAEAIDREVQATLQLGFRMALDALDRNAPVIEQGVRRLLEVETLDEEEVAELWKNYGQPAAGWQPALSA